MFRCSGACVLKKLDAFQLLVCNGMVVLATSASAYTAIDVTYIGTRHIMIFCWYLLWSFPVQISVQNDLVCRPIIMVHKFDSHRLKNLRLKSLLFLLIYRYYLTWRWFWLFLGHLLLKFCLSVCALLASGLCQVSLLNVK